MPEKHVFYNAAIKEAIQEEMKNNPDVFIMGEDVATYGGVFKVTDGLLEKFGPDRVRDTPISEAAIVGAAIGAAIHGMRPIVEIMFADFTPIILDQVVNNASQLHFISGGQISVPLVIRTPGGAAPGGGAHHTKSLVSWFTHIPGLKVVAPATPYDAKGLLKSSVRDNNPVFFYENKLLYKTTGPIPEEEYLVEIGRADIKREGKDVTIVAWSNMVIEALTAAEKLASAGIDAEIVDLRTLSPLDEDTIFESVKKTNRAVVVQHEWKNTGFGAEVVARIQENVFDYLDGPILRIAGVDTPIPASPSLIKTVVPGADDIVAQVKKYMAG